MDNLNVNRVIMILLIVVLGVAAYSWRDVFLPQAETPLPAPPEAKTVEPVVETGPRHPLEPLVPPGGGPRALEPLPPLDDSDAYFLLDVRNVLGNEIEALLLRDAIIDRLVATIDNLPRDRVSDKIRPARGLAELFRPTTEGSGEIMYLGFDSYQRFDPIVSRVATADIDTVTDIYRRFYPLFQKSYERLGYPNAYFNDRVIEVIDHLLATPAPAEPIALVRPNVLYEFRDPALESLSSGQKLLLRMGPAHTETMKNVLRELRSRLARPNGQ